MEFNAIETLKKIVEDIEGKLPTDLLEYFEEQVKSLGENGITIDTHVGKADFAKVIEAAEFLLGQFIGIVKKGKENKVYYNTFPNWLKHVYHFVIDNKANLE